MSSLNFARIINPVCSCGNYIGRYQPEIEFRLIRDFLDSDKVTDDEDVSRIITDLGIKRMCCRNTILISPILRLVETEPELTIYLDRRNINDRIDRISIGNPDLDINSLY